MKLYVQGLVSSSTDVHLVVQLLLLQAAGQLFPGSDFHHPVMSPVKAFLRQLLGQAAIRDARDVLCALHSCTLLGEVSVLPDRSGRGPVTAGSGSGWQSRL